MFKNPAGVKVLFSVFYVISLHSSQKKNQPKKSHKPQPTQEKNNNPQANKQLLKQTSPTTWKEAWWGRGWEGVDAFGVSVWTALNKCKRLKSSTTTTHPHSLTRKSRSMFVDRPVTIAEFICYLPPLPLPLSFLLSLLFLLIFSEFLPVCVLSPHRFN